MLKNDNSDNKRASHLTFSGNHLSISCFPEISLIYEMLSWPHWPHLPLACSLLGKPGTSSRSLPEKVFQRKRDPAACMKHVVVWPFQKATKERHWIHLLPVKQQLTKVWQDHDMSIFPPTEATSGSETGIETLIHSVRTISHKEEYLVLT